MRIERLEIENLGPHKHLDLDMDASVVGIVGNNGAGKSNILTAIDIALDKNLNKRNKETYIRNFGMEDGATKATIKLWWRKNGKAGHIVCTIQASGIRRKLTWDGETFTKDAEVTAKIGEIMGVDKAAITNAIFTKQGQLADLINGTPSERQGLFFRLLNLGFLEPRAAELARSIDSIKDSYIDYGPALDEVKASIKELTIELEEAKAKLAAYRDTSAMLSNLAALQLARTEVDTVSRLIDVHQGVMRKSQSELQSLLAEAGYNSRDEMAQALQDSYYVANELAAKINQLSQHQRNRKEWDYWHPILREATNDCQILEQELATSEKVEELTVKLEALRVEHARCIAVEESGKHVEQCLKEKEGASQELIRLITLRDSEEMVNCRHTIDTCNKSLEPALIQLGDYQRTLSLYNTDGSAKMGECPTCGRAIADISEAEIAQLQTSLSNVTAQIKQLKEIIAANEKKLQLEVEGPISCAGDRCIATDGMYVSAMRQYRQLTSETVPRSADIIGEEIATVEGKMSRVQELETQLREAQMQRATAEKALSNYLEPGCEPKIVKQDDLEALLKQQKEYSTYRDTLYDFVNRANSIVHSISVYSTALDTEDRPRLETANSVLEEKLKLLEADFTEAEMVVILSGEFEEFCESLRNELMWHNTHKKTVETLERSLAAKEARETEIWALIGKNSKKMELVKELAEARSLILKTGVPSMYMSDVFKKVVGSVNQLLEQMEANFYVTEDKDTPLTFKFVRVDDSSGYEMPQATLSGGQAIRLALALLVSVQKLVLPEVGLLVLDEPSSHIDADGVQSMASMFLRLGEIWENSDMQLIIVDHNPALISSVGKLIRLSNSQSD